MFYLTKGENSIYINGELEIATEYELVFKNKDEFNVEHTFNITPTAVNERFTTFTFDATALKNGSYKFNIYNSMDSVYNDICFMEFETEEVIVKDETDKKIIIT